MTKPAAITAAMLLLTVLDGPKAKANPLELRVTGRAGTRAGDPSESARRLALADARRRALESAAAHLRKRADIKALQLPPGQLEAFTAVLVDVVEPASELTNGRIAAVARLDAEGAAGVLLAVRRIRTSPSSWCTPGDESSSCTISSTSVPNAGPSRRATSVPASCRSNCRSPARST